MLLRGRWARRIGFVVINEGLDVGFHDGDVCQEIILTVEIVGTAQTPCVVDERGIQTNVGANTVELNLETTA